jgi:hypothetical protein
MTKAKKEKVIETVVLTYQEYTFPEVSFPSKFCFRDANGDFIFIKTSKRSIAEQYIKDNYDGRYSLREV